MIELIVSRSPRGCLLLSHPIPVVLSEVMTNHSLPKYTLTPRKGINSYPPVNIQVSNMLIDSLYVRQNDNQLFFVGCSLARLVSLDDFAQAVISQLEFQFGLSAHSPSLNSTKGTQPPPTSIANPKTRERREQRTGDLQPYQGLSLCSNHSFNNPSNLKSSNRNHSLLTNRESDTSLCAKLLTHSPFRTSLSLYSS
jgi:hypothetical protein